MSKEFLMGLKRNEIEVELDGKKYIVKECTIAEYLEYTESLLNKEPNAQCKLVLSTLHDANGARVFDKKDIALIEMMPASVVSMLWAKAMLVIKYQLSKEATEESSKN